MSEMQYLSITEVRESPNNPRRRFNEQKMQELIDSVKLSGVLVPLLVRPIDLREKSETNLEAMGLLPERKSTRLFYEILAGARRYRAAQAAGLSEIPAIIKDVNDNEALEIQLFENEKREDVHPLEQAMGYQRLVDRSYTAPAIAAKLGCSESHVYKRLKLLDLIAPAQEAFLDDKITTEHAILIARLQPGDQARAFEECFEDDWSVAEPNAKKTISAKELANWIENKIHLDLNAAPFKLGDEELLTEAGSCINCNKRTGFIPQLFPDVAKKDTCTDGSCYQRKVQAHIDRSIEKAQKKKQDLVQISSEWQTKNNSVLPASKYKAIEKKDQACEHAQKAIVVDGTRGRGEVIQICSNPDCPVHGKKAREQNLQDSDWAKKQKQEELARKKENRIREGIFHAIIEQAYKRGYDKEFLDREDKNLIAQSLLNSIGGASLDIFGKGTKDEPIEEVIERRIPVMSDDDLDALLLKLCLCPLVWVRSWGELTPRPEILTNTAERFGVDIAAIEKEVEKQERKKKKQETKEAKSETEITPAETKSKKKETKGKKKQTPQEEPCEQTCDSCKRPGRN